jgi:hypothetical protein
LGLADVVDGELVRSSLRFNAPMTLYDVTFAPEEMLLSARRCEQLLATWVAEETSREEDIPPEPPHPPESEPQVTQTEEEAGTSVPRERRYRRVWLVISGIASGKIADVNRGIFVPMSNLADDGLTFTLELDVTSSEGIPESMLESKVKETVRQIGARVLEEDAE